MIKPDLTIIQSPEAERMRQMVTEGFYDRSRIGLWMYEVIGREYDDMAKWARTLRTEIFPQTCTWSIVIWEFVYDFEPDDSLSLEFRRQRILSRRLRRPPINPARIEAVLSALTGYPVHITDPIAPYTFLVEIYVSSGMEVDYEHTYRVLREIKPSHLRLNITYEFEPAILNSQPLFLGIGLQFGGSITIAPWAYVQPDMRSEPKIAHALSIHGTTTINRGESA